MWGKREREEEVILTRLRRVCVYCFESFEIQSTLSGKKFGSNDLINENTQPFGYLTSKHWNRCSVFASYHVKYSQDCGKICVCVQNDIEPFVGMDTPKMVHRLTTIDT